MMDKYKFILFTFHWFCGTNAIAYYYMDNHCGDTIDVGNNHQIRLKLTSRYNYPSDFSCQVTVRTARPNSEDRLMMYFKNIDTESICSDDWVELHDGQGRSASYIGSGKYCGSHTSSGVFTTSGRYMTIYFHSDGSIQGKGFDMFITSFHTGYCLDYSCSNGRCIDNSLRCNGFNPCGDYSDCGISAGAIAGIVVSCAMFMTAIIIISIVVYRRKRAVTVHQSTRMSGLATIQTTVGGYPYNQPVPQNYAAPPPPYPETTVTTTQYPVTTGVTTVQY